MKIKQILGKEPQAVRFHRQGTLTQIDDFVCMVPEWARPVFASGLSNDLCVALAMPYAVFKSINQKHITRRTRNIYKDRVWSC